MRGPADCHSIRRRLMRYVFFVLVEEKEDMNSVDKWPSSFWSAFLTNVIEAHRRSRSGLGPTSEHIWIATVARIARHESGRDGRRSLSRFCDGMKVSLMANQRTGDMCSKRAWTWKQFHGCAFPFSLLVLMRINFHIPSGEISSFSRWILECTSSACDHNLVFQSQDSNAMPISI